MVLTSLAIGTLFLLGGASFWAARAADVEEPAFQLVSGDGPFELRLYGPTIEARTRLDDSSRSSMSGGFRRLASYIFGGNDRNQSIAMTAPVSRFEGEGGWNMSFTMPSEWELEQLPQPLREDVNLISVESKLVAALRFSGWARPAVVEKKEAELLAAIKDAGLRVVGPIRLAQYDPPSQLPPLRRNEILVPVARTEQVVPSDSALKQRAPTSD